jgi:IclR family pca regulon transcriptional regulator
VLLAAKGKAEFNAWMKARALTRLTGHTVADPKSFRALIAQVREQDFCLASEEHELAVHALAVPLRDMGGRTVAALNVVTTRQRLEPKSLQKELLPLLQEAASEARPLL